ncbi:hypothetical protein DPMN_108161 [Dreissena polymorpha]|uniref:Uncharacterized protein n=1 Tax=Dreissena polymorpha TaxID=45954 RepID=A0A9D4K894_DREPO|nr:hypothetical protein DPMN_108161 [Dreissena polymorpha]
MLGSFKLKYRLRQLQHVLAELEKDKTKLGLEILRQIAIPQAIYCASGAWREFLGSQQRCNLVVYPKSDTDDNDESPLAVLKMSRDLFDCEYSDLVDIDKTVHTCDSNMTNWERNAFETDEEKNTSEPKNVTLRTLLCVRKIIRMILFIDLISDDDDNDDDIDDDYKDS